MNSSLFFFSAKTQVRRFDRAFKAPATYRFWFWPGVSILQNAPPLLGEGRPHELAQGAYFYYFQGTSMAAPYVAGLSALLFQRGVRDPAQMKAILVGTSDQRVGEVPYVNAVAALASVGRPPAAPPKKRPAPQELEPRPSYRFNAGAVATTPASSGIVLLLALAGAILFQVLRTKHRSLQKLFTPLLFTGLVLGATGFLFLGFLQEQFPLTILPERFSGLLFNSILDYDRVLFFLSQPSPLWHNFLVAAAFMVLLNFRDERKRRFTIGLLLGFSAKLLHEGIFVRELAWLPDGFVASAFLIVNALVVFLFPFVMAKNE